MLGDILMTTTNETTIVNVFVLTSSDKRQKDSERVYLTLDGATEFQDTENASLKAKATTDKANGKRPNLAQWECHARQAVLIGKQYKLIASKPSQVWTGDTKMDILTMLGSGGQLTEAMRLQLAQMLSE